MSAALLSAAAAAGKKVHAAWGGFRHKVGCVMMILGSGGGETWEIITDFKQRLERA